MPALKTSLGKENLQRRKKRKRRKRISNKSMCRYLNYTPNKITTRVFMHCSFSSCSEEEAESEEEGEDPKLDSLSQAIAFQVKEITSFASNRCGSQLLWPFCLLCGRTFPRVRAAAGQILFPYLACPSCRLSHSEVKGPFRPLYLVSAPHSTTCFLCFSTSTFPWLTTLVPAPLRLQPCRADTGGGGHTTAQKTDWLNSLMKDKGSPA